MCILLRSCGPAPGGVRRRAGVSPDTPGRGWLPDHLDAHRARGALDDLHAGLDVVDVEVGQLDLRDLADLVTGDLAGRRALRRGRALVDAGGLAQEVRRGRGLEDEGERAILEDRDLRGDDLARLVGGLLVV